RQGWNAGEGYIAGKSGDRQPAPWLTGQKLLPSTGLTEAGIAKGSLTTVKNELFTAPRTAARYQPPLMLIRENEKLQCGFWDRDRGFLAYKDKIVGIHAPETQRDALLQFFNDFRS